MTGNSGNAFAGNVVHRNQPSQAESDPVHSNDHPNGTGPTDNLSLQPSNPAAASSQSRSGQEIGSASQQDNNGHSDEPPRSIISRSVTTTIMTQQPKKEEQLTPKLFQNRRALSQDVADHDSEHHDSVDEPSLLPPLAAITTTTRRGGRPPFQDSCCGECQVEPCACFGNALGRPAGDGNFQDNNDDDNNNNNNNNNDGQTGGNLYLQLQRENARLERTVEDLNRKFDQMETRMLRTNRRSLMLHSHGIPIQDGDDNGDDPEGTRESAGSHNNKTRGLFASWANFASRRQASNTKTEALPQDSFSFMVVAPVCSIPFISAMALFAIQITAFLLLTVNLIDPTNADNPFGIPVNVKPAVRGTQLIALTITVLTQDDIRTGLNQINNGYNHETIGKAFPHGATYTKWVFSVVARCFEGSLSLIVTFFLIATSGTVLDLLLNFTAMEFVSQLDELFFTLAEQGFVGKRNLLQADQIAQTTYSVTKRRCHVSPFLLLIVTMIAMITAWTSMMLRQTNGTFVCDTVFVQFGDDFVPALGAFSGLYDREPGYTRVFSSDRVRYIERRSGKAMFEYCNHLRHWTFVYNANEDGSTTAEFGGSCQWHAKSPETTSFDLLDMADSVWNIRNGAQMEIQLDRFYMQCYDCDKMDPDNLCEGRGTCSHGVCSCVDGWFGLRCEHHAPCPTLEMDSRYGGFLGTREWSNSFEQLRNNDTDQSPVMVYDRPVYVHEYKAGQFDMLLFIGRRWIATTSGYFNTSFDGADDPRQALSEYLTHGFHAFWSNAFAVFISTPTDVETPSDVGTPVGLEWYHAHKLTSTHEKDLQAVDVAAGSMDARLLCPVCSEINPCFFDSECHEGVCECHMGAVGALCQIPPVGNGHCDPLFNNPEFNYDGGDCCETTCVSSRDFSCGKDHTGFVDVGYYFCHLPVQVWYPHGQPINGDHYTQLGASVALSANGRVLLVGEPEADQVRLYDKDGSNWIVRGRPMEGPLGSRFGSFVAMSAGWSDAVSNPLSHSKIWVVVGAPEAKFIRMYECSTHGCFQYGEDIPGVVADISSDGTTIVIGTETNFTVYEQSGEDSWMAVLTKSGFGFIYSILLSGDGRTIAVGSLDYNITVVGDEGVFDAVNNRYIFTLDGLVLSPKGNDVASRIYFSETFEALRFSKIGNIAFYRKSMAISEDGNTLAVGATTSLVETGVQVYVFDETRGWTTQGGNVSNSDGDMLEGRSFSLSANGRVAIGAAIRNGQDSGIFAFDWNGTEWVQLGDSLPGGEDSSVAISTDGAVLAVGLPFFNSKMAGSCFLYHFSPKPCPDGTTLLRLSLTLDEYPADTSWDLSSNETGEVIMSGEGYSHEYEQATVVHEACVPEHHQCTVFTIYDRVDTRFASIGRYSNGMDPPGLYTLLEAGNSVAVGTPMGSAERVYLGDCLSTCPTGSQRVSVLIRTCLAFSWNINNKVTGETVIHDADPAYCGQGLEGERSKWKDACVPVDSCLSFSIHANSGQPDYLNQTGIFDPYGSSNSLEPTLRDENETSPLAQALDVTPVGGSIFNGLRQLAVSPVNLLFYVYIDSVEVARGSLALQPGFGPSVFPIGNCTPVPDPK